MSIPEKTDEPSQLLNKIPSELRANIYTLVLRASFPLQHSNDLIPFVKNLAVVSSYNHVSGIRNRMARPWYFADGTFVEEIASTPDPPGTAYPRVIGRDEYPFSTALLSTCKQIFIEALPEFYAHNTIVLPHLTRCDLRLQETMLTTDLKFVTHISFDARGKTGQLHCRHTPEMVAQGLLNLLPRLKYVAYPEDYFPDQLDFFALYMSIGERARVKCKSLGRFTFKIEAGESCAIEAREVSRAWDAVSALPRVHRPLPYVPNVECKDVKTRCLWKLDFDDGTLDKSILQMVESEFVRFCALYPAFEAHDVSSAEFWTWLVGSRYV